MTAGSIKHVKQITIEKYSSFIEYRYQTSALCYLKKSTAVFAIISVVVVSVNTSAIKLEVQLFLGNN